MNAQVVWDVWRRILREDALQAALFTADFAERAVDFGLSDQETAIALEYARTPKETRWAIDTYRFRSFNVIVEALYVAAPFTARLLQRRGFDLDVLARDYLATVQWKDQGPYTYRTCEGTLEFLNRNLGGERDPELSELIGFELVTIGLMRRLAGRVLSPPDPDHAAAAERDDVRFLQTGQGVTLSTRFDLTPWLRNPDTIGMLSLAPGRLSFLRYIRSWHDEPALITLRERGLRAYELLSSPRSVPELSALLNDEDPTSTAGTVRRFIDLGVVQRTAG